MSRDHLTIEVFVHDSKQVRKNPSKPHLRRLSSRDTRRLEVDSVRKQGRLEVDSYVK